MAITTTVTNNVTYEDDVQIITKVTTEFNDETSIKTVTTDVTRVDLTGGTVSFDDQIVEEIVVGEEIVTTEVERHYWPDIELNRIYRFTFVSDFAQLGYQGDGSQTGIYKVSGKYTYLDILGSTQIDIWTDLYEKYGVSEAQYKEDEKKFPLSTWYRLSNPSDTTQEFFVPDCLMKYLPEANIASYDMLLLAVKLGAIKDPALVTEITGKVSDLLEAEYGIQEEVTLTRYREIFLSEDEYQALEAQRLENKTGSTNYIATINQLSQSLTNARAQIVTLEDKIEELLT